MKCTITIKVTITIIEPVVIVTGVLEGQSEAATMLRLPWLLCSLSFSLLPLILLLIQHFQSLIQKIPLNEVSI